jgi:1,4-dihydroxy-2-naphthoyl-CoA synthase
VSWSQIEQVQELTARTIAGLRCSDEGQEGFNAFFEKRRPGWDPEA